MSRPLFTAEELEELRRIDAELEKMPLTREEFRAAAQRDKEALSEAISSDEVERLEAYRRRRKKHYKRNREKAIAYMREYKRKNKELYQDIGEKIREARKSAGLRVQDVADMCRVTDSAVYRWEGGETKPHMEKLLAALPNLKDAIGGLECLKQI